MKQLFCVMLIIVTALFIVPAHTATPPKKSTSSFEVTYFHWFVKYQVLEPVLHPKDPRSPSMLHTCAGQCQCASILGKQNGATNNGGVCVLAGGSSMTCDEFCNGGS